MRGVGEKVEREVAEEGERFSAPGCLVGLAAAAGASAGFPSAASKTSSVTCTAEATERRDSRC